MDDSSILSGPVGQSGKGSHIPRGDARRATPGAGDREDGGSRAASGGGQAQRVRRAYDPNQTFREVNALLIFPRASARPRTARF